MISAEKLPDEILSRASLRGGEYAWPLADIPAVIEAARAANLLNIGGQLQFRLPDQAICECYWVEVDTYRTVSKKQSWNGRVEAAAADALSAFRQLPDEYDFLAEGQKAFAEHLDALKTTGRDPRDAMCFAWYVAGAEDERGEAP
ncbi:hypothetical protein [Caulobacter hibisci]|uniref:Uncharacterized protein n=1 Tax=Caulobacter hibisci TaxID=2035993 RepID=A0ABS0SSA1_9CAUL|nr:hypothetical protein [Caulobacter hibisci]MBI1682502.1 hypothetical protein [Caulobacter hibisci]